MFRNLIVTQLTNARQMTAEGLAEALHKHRFVPCDIQQTRSLGWVRPFDEEAYALQCGDFIYLSLRIEAKTVPADAIRRWVKEKADALEQVRGCEPGLKEKAELAERAVHELLPLAFPKGRDIDVVIDTRDGWLLTDATSETVFDEVVAKVFEFLTECRMESSETRRKAVELMQAWLLANEAPGRFEMGDTLFLKGKGVVRYDKQALPIEEIHRHLTAGMRPERMELTFDKRVTFKLGAEGELRSVNFDQTVKDEVIEAARGDRLADFKAALMIEVGELRAVLAALEAEAASLEAAKRVEEHAA